MNNIYFQDAKQLAQFLNEIARPVSVRNLTDGGWAVDLEPKPPAPEGYGTFAGTQLTDPNPRPRQDDRELWNQFDFAMDHVNRKLYMDRAESKLNAFANGDAVAERLKNLAIIADYTVVTPLGNTDAKPDSLPTP